MFDMNREELRRRKDEEILEDAQEADINVPWLYRWYSVKHYYGDTVRQLFLMAAALMLVGAPFYSNNLTVELPFIVFGAVALIAVAAFTSPVKQNAIRADAVAAGVGLVIFEVWALWNFQTDPIYKFVLREALALIFLAALYFSTKTLRGMLLGGGFNANPREHDMHIEEGTLDEVIQRQPNWKQEAREIINEVNDRQKDDYND
jgi:hypothetical protein